MKSILVIFPLLFIAIGCVTTHSKSFIPTPDQAISMKMGDDPIKWEMDHLDAGPTGFIAEFVPIGQTINAWKEMVSQQITFTGDSNSKHIANWKDMITQGDPKVVIIQIATDSASTTVSYQSQAFNEYSLRRFIQGSDGIYAFAYHVRLDEMDEARVKLWSDIITDSKLIKNPQKR